MQDFERTSRVKVIIYSQQKNQSNDLKSEQLIRLQPNGYK